MEIKNKVAAFWPRGSKILWKPEITFGRLQFVSRTQDLQTLTSRSRLLSGKALVRLQIASLLSQVFCKLSHYSKRLTAF
jgi:hypothetical protein